MTIAIDDALSMLVGGASWSGHGVAVRRVRDLSLLELGDRTLVVATDSNASIGGKPADYLAQDPVLTGYSAAKVPIMEVLAAGAVPVLLIDNLCVELQPTGLELVRGIREALDEAGLDILITGSDESNMPTVQTGVGVTVLGIAGPGELRIGGIRAGDELWLAGRRASGLPGDEYEARGDGIAAPSQVLAAVRAPGIHEVLPVGSHGIEHEAREMAATGGVGLVWETDIATDLSASAGASTCFLVAAAPGAATALRRLGLPLELLARAATTKGSRS